MSLIDNLVERLQRHPKRIVFPDGANPRVLQAARLITSRQVGVPVLLGDRADIKNKAYLLDIKLGGTRIIEPRRSDDLEYFVAKLRALDAFAGKDSEALLELAKKPDYFAALMVATGRADALIAGASADAPCCLRPLLDVLSTDDGRGSTVSSLQILDSDNRDIGCEGALFLAHCGLVPEPNARQLRDVALSAGEVCHQLTHDMPRVAFLSYSTHTGESQSANARKLSEAVRLVRECEGQPRCLIEVDGELEVDAALDAFVAKNKGVGGNVAGRANVLVFPDLSSGSIASKLVQIVAEAPLYGQFLGGLQRPCAKVSRGASAHDVYGTAVITASQGIRERMLVGS